MRGLYVFSISFAFLIGGSRELDFGNRMLQFEPAGPVSNFATKLMRPLMSVLAGTFNELPQDTHRWNNVHLSRIQILQLDEDLFTELSADPSAGVGWWFFKHIYIVPGIGWSEYEVFEPPFPVHEWYVGAVWEGGGFLSQKSLSGPVRLTRGPKKVNVFGLSVDGTQLPIRRIGHGRVGAGGEFSRVPLR